MKYAMEHCTIEGIETYILTPESAKSLLNDAGELSRLHLNDVYIEALKYNVGISKITSISSCFQYL